MLVVFEDGDVCLNSTCSWYPGRGYLDNLEPRIGGRYSSRLEKKGALKEGDQISPDYVDATVISELAAVAEHRSSVHCSTKLEGSFILLS